VGSRNKWRKLGGWSQIGNGIFGLGWKVLDWFFGRQAKGFATKDTKGARETEPARDTRGGRRGEPQPHRYPTQPHRTRLCEPPSRSFWLRWALKRHAVEPRRHSGRLLWLREKLCDERTGHQEPQGASLPTQSHRTRLNGAPTVVWATATRLGSMHLFRPQRCMLGAELIRNSNQFYQSRPIPERSFPDHKTI